MDISAFRLLQDSGWIREQRDRINSGERAACPVTTCDGRLVPFSVEAPTGHPVGDGIQLPGGVLCEACGARSRAVVL